MKVNVSVKPNSTKGSLVELQPDGSLVVYIREIAADGKANVTLVKLLSDYYKIPKSRIAIIRGHTNKHKLVEILK